MGLHSFPFKHKYMDISFETLSIEVVDSWFPHIPTGIAVSTELDNVVWNYSYNIESELYLEELDFDLVGVTLYINLVEENIFEPDPICSLQQRTLFKVTTGLPNDIKLQILQMFLGICVGQAQGIYASKNQHNYLSKMAPPFLDVFSIDNELLTLIEKEW